MLEITHSALYSEFMKGHFTIQNTRGSCSNAAIDHAHEQENVTINGEGWAIGLFQEDKALRR